MAKVFNTPKKPVKELSSRTKKLESKINDAAEKLDHAEPQEFDENKENAAAERLEVESLISETFFCSNWE